MAIFGFFGVLVSLRGGSSVEFVDNFGKNIVAELVAVYFDKETKGLVMLENRESFGAEFLQAVFENLETFVVFALATVVQSLGGVKTVFNIGFGDVKQNSGFDFVTGAGGNRHDLIFFAGPTTDARED